MFPRRLRSVPGDDWWQNMTFAPVWDSLTTLAFCLTLSLILIYISSSALASFCFWKEEKLQEGSRLLHFPSWRTLLRSLRVKGKTDKLGDSWLRVGQKRCWFNPQNQLRRGSLYLRTDLEPLFRTSSRSWPKHCFKIHRDGLSRDWMKPSEWWDLYPPTPPNPTVGCASKKQKKN